MIAHQKIKFQNQDGSSSQPSIISVFSIISRVGYDGIVYYIDEKVKNNILKEEDRIRWGKDIA